MFTIAERYVRLVLAVGRHDPDYVDAYYGPADWAARPAGPPAPVPRLRREAARLLDDLAALTPPAPGGSATGSEVNGAEPGEPTLERLRHDYLACQLRAVDARLRMLEGERLSFDEESRALYDAVAPVHADGFFADTLAALHECLPGNGPLVDRLEQYRSAFVIPPARLDAVFSAAIAECRSRTLRHLALPAGERFAVEYVTDKPWSGYNWYKGAATSVIQVNIDLPIYIDRAIDLAAHEGYPGHHVYNALLEAHLVRERGWQEFSVYALFSPQSLIAEGTANFGIEVAFPGPERVAVDRELLFPLAGIDPGRAEEYAAVTTLTGRLAYAGNEAARRFVNGAIDAAGAAAWLEQYALMPRTRAEQRVRFFERYRSYVINYNLGTDLVRAYVERRGGTPDRPARRWAVFAALLSSPRVPGSLG